MKQKVLVACGAVVLLLGIIFIACSSDSSNLAKVTGDFRVMSTDITSCKTETRSTDEGEDDEYVHVLEYEAKRDGTLHLKDVNRVVSCSLQAMDVKTSLEGDVITIDEYEITGDVVSTCVCPVDFDITVGPLEDGDYTLVYCIAGEEQARISFHYDSQLKGSYTIVPKEPEKPIFIEEDGIRYTIIESSKICRVSGKWNKNGRNEYSGDIIIPENVIYEGNTYQVTAIEGTAFMNCTEVTSVSLPNSITTIYDMAFFNCGIRSIDIPASVTSIYPFAFQCCRDLETINMPATMTSIAFSAFNGCTSLTSIVLPEGITDLYNELFSNCVSLKSVTIPESVTTIYYQAFESCKSLESITLPSHLSYIYHWAFAGCSNLSKIYSLNPVAPVIDATSDKVFDDSVIQNATLYVPKGSKEAYSTANYWNRFVHIEEIKD